MFELTLLYEKAAAYAKRHKAKAVFFYLLLIFYSAIPVFQVPFLEYHTVRFSSLMDQRIQENYLLYYPEQDAVCLDDVAPVLLKSIIAMEDGSFFMHKGIDWEQLELSMKSNTRRKRKLRGGSTITMQLTKNVYFTTRRSVIRKAKELLVTARMEKEVSKYAILQNYINIVEWGDGIFGAEKAASGYFKKSASELNLTEASKMAAVIPAPLKYSPAKSGSYVNRRSAIIRSRYSDVQLFPEL